MLGVLAGDFDHFLDSFEEAVFSLANAAIDGAVIGKGVDNLVTDESEVSLVILRRIAGEEAGRLLIGIGTIEVVGIDNRKGAVDFIARGEDSVGGSPGFLASLGNGVARGKVVEFLVSVGDFDLTGELGPDGGLEGFGEVLADDENDLGESGADGVKNRVVQNGFAIGAHRVHLFQTTVTAAHTGGENNECRRIFHVGVDLGAMGVEWQGRISIVSLVKGSSLLYSSDVKICVVGKGGREHALIRALGESASQPEVFCFPGSEAIHEIEGAGKVEAHDLDSLMSWMTMAGIDLCVAGEESYLVTGEGLANRCENAGIPCWGPPFAGAQMEASKEFAKEFMQRHEIPTGAASGCADVEEARAAIAGKYPTVLKFDGLAAGKGVAVCPDEVAAEEFLQEVMVERRFGPGRLLVEECLIGPEISIFAAVSGPEYLILTPARDYKRIGEGDEGPNTGGMGAVASRQLADAGLMKKIEEEIVAPTVAGLEKDGLNYKGFLYFGLMLTADGPKIIEYNCRFGDPECQAVMPLVSGDLARFCFEGAKGNLKPDLLSFSEGWSVCCILASAGYPESSRVDDVISGLDEVSEARIYHAGTKKVGDDWFTNGGRVLAIVAGGETREEAVVKAHDEAAKVTFDGSQRRNDIGRLHF